MRGAERADQAAGGAAEVAVLESMERLLASKRLEQLTVADVLENAGVSRASFYFYFESKQAVVAALLERVIGEVYDAARPWFEGDGDPEEDLRTAIEASGEAWRRHAPILNAAVEGWRSSPEIGDLWGTHITRFSEASAARIERDRRAGAAPPGSDARRLAAALVWMNERCFYVAGTDGEPAFAPEGAPVDALVAIWMSAVYGGGVA
jgi:TetR/AcrR family transcriptional regulator, ethionamide resistance regulator